MTKVFQSKLPEVQIRQILRALRCVLIRAWYEDEMGSAPLTGSSRVLMVPQMAPTASPRWPSALLLIFALIAPTAIASDPPDYVSINCGGSEDYTDNSTGFLWQTDSSYIFSGFTSVGATWRWKVPLELQTVRFFGAPSPRKNCYVIPTEEDKTYLVRAGFLCNTYDRFNATPDTAFNISMDNTVWDTMTCTNSSLGQPRYFEAITAQSKESSLSFCLIGLDHGGTPFINSLELRRIPEGAYNATVYSLSMSDAHLFLINRVNFGERKLTYRYPDDPWDRRWVPYLQVFPDSEVQMYRDLSVDPSSIRVDTEQHYAPPQKVMSTAIEGPTISFTFPLPPHGTSVFFILYFAEIGMNTTSSALRIMEGHAPKRGIYNGTVSILLDLTHQVPPLSAYAMPIGGYAPSLGFSSEEYIPQLNVTFSRTRDSTLDAILNAAELYVLMPGVLGTVPSDHRAMLRMKEDLKLVRWTGDPCVPVPWEGVLCTPDAHAKLIHLMSRKLSGSIPEAIGDLSSLSELSLSDNRFTGSIPSTFARLTRLKYLNLSNNNISGIFPEEMFEGLQSLTTLDVSNNQLRGTISESLIKKLGIDNFKFSGNPGLVVCYQNGTTCVSKHPRMSRVLFLATCLSAAVVFTFCLLPVIYVTNLYHSSTNGLFDREYRRLQERLLTRGAKAKPLSLAKVRTATRGFREKIGEGGFGAVYYGKLKGRQEVAVKVLSIKSHQGNLEFLNEIELLSVVHHKYLVSLVGYCRAWRQKILVYEYLKGGDLHGWLHGSKAAAEPLSWKERTCIIMEVAEGLEYLHHGCNPMVIHRDVKAMNILLDENKRAKVADFGLSRLLAMGAENVSHITTIVKGTTGYMDPEYYTSQKLTDKSDVYSFGVLILEIITGRPPINPKAFTGNAYILQAVRHAMKAGMMEELVDPNLGGDCDIQVFHHLVDLSLGCVEASSKNRPAMTEVVQHLRNMGLVTGNPIRDDLGGHSDYSEEIHRHELHDESSGGDFSSTLSRNRDDLVR